MANMPSSWLSAGSAGLPGRHRAAPAAPVRAGMRLMALEPRMLFDGAAAVAVDAVQQSVEPRCADANAAPVANADTRDVQANAPLTDGSAVAGDTSGDVADTDADCDPLTVVAVSAGLTDKPSACDVGQPVAGCFGTLQIQSDGSYTYTPNDDLALGAGDTVQDVFSYQISDGRGGHSTSSITLVVHGVDCNAPPVARDDARDLSAGSQLTDGQAICGNALGDNADSDPEGGELRIQGAIAGATGDTLDGGAGEQLVGAFGTLVIQADGAYTYTPSQAGRALAAGQTVQDVFTYTVVDPACNVDNATITINLVGVAGGGGCDSGGNGPPDANNDERFVRPSGTVDDGQAIAGDPWGDVADSDPDGDALHVTGVVPGDSGGIPVAGVDQPVHGDFGTLTLHDDGSYTYTPDAGVVVAPGESLQDVFTYGVTDGNGGTDRATLTITIIPDNHPPLANPDQRSLVRDQVIQNGQAVLGDAFGDRADVDPDGDSLTVVGVAAGDLGADQSGGVGDAIVGQWGTLVLAADGSYTYVPGSAALALQPGDHATDVFTYTVSDSDCAMSTTTITIALSGSDALTARPDVRTTDEDHPVSGNVVQGGAPGENADSDDSGHAIALQGVGAGDTAATLTSGTGVAVAGSYGALTLNPDGSYTYVPGSAAQALRAGQSVDDVFTYTINDGHGITSTTTLTIHIDGLNDSPTANPDANSIRSDATVPATGNAIANGSAGDQADTDTDAGETLTVTGVRPGTAAGANTAPGQPVAGQYGQLTLNPDGSYSYTVDRSNPEVAGLTQGQTRTDNFTYTIRDSGGDTSSATVTIVVNGVPAGGGAGPPPPAPPPPPGPPPPPAPVPPPGPVGQTPPEPPLLLPIVPSGFTGSVTNGAGAPVPQLTEVSVKPTPDYRLLLPPDSGNPFGIERVKGVVEEAPTRSTSTSEEAVTKAVKRDDDCLPVPRKMVAGHVERKPVDRPSVFAKPALEKPKSFSEQLKTAQKRLRVPVKVAPRPVQRVC